MAIVAACAISVSLTSVAAISGLVSDPSSTVKRPAFLSTIASSLQGVKPAADPVVAALPAVSQQRTGVITVRSNKGAAGKRRKFRVAAAQQ